MHRLCFVLLLIGLYTVTAQNWVYSNDGWAWAPNCDFVANDMNTVYVSGQNCGPTCGQTDGCTHFAWTPPNNCYLKNNPVSQSDAITSNTGGILCGFNVNAGPVSPPPSDNSGSPPADNGITWNYDNAGIAWSNGCDFVANDLYSVQAAGSDCGPTCLSTDGCTHFAWTPPSNCYLKGNPSSVSDAISSGTDGILCGVVPSSSSSTTPPDASTPPDSSTPPNSSTPPDASTPPDSSSTPDPSAAAPTSSYCFPMTRSWGSGPGNTSINDWWCGPDDVYGFLGFSYPVEDDCSGYSYNSFLSDFNNMKNKYGATFVRLYLPVCRQTSFWVDMVKAARDSSLALIPMIWWDWQQNDAVMNEAETAFMGIFTSSDTKDIAPYIIHSVAFGDELGEEGNYWTSPMSSFKQKLAPYSVPIAITDDWDRDVYKSGNSLTTFGKQVQDISDLTQAHIMPYYHPSEAVDAYHMWDYFNSQLNFLTDTTNNFKRPILISQTCWAYNQDGHQRGSNDQADTMDNYVEYWNVINSNCQLFTSLKVGWFFHTYRGEPGFDLIGSNGQPVTNFVPAKC